MKPKLNIMLHGFININVMEGSAVFITGLAKMLSLNPNIQIDLVLATPINRDILIRDLYDIDNINIISPFDDDELTSLNPTWYRNRRFTYEEMAHVVTYYWNQRDYDWLIVRSMEVVKELYKADKTIMDRIMTYVTGITSDNQEFSQEQIEDIETIFRSSAYLLCQTEEMKFFLVERFQYCLTNTEIITLNPMIPDTSPNFDDFFEEKEVYNKLCYVGKFHPEWNPIPMIVGFRESLYSNSDTTFTVAGDKFSVNKVFQPYNEDLKYLLENTTNLTWYGALTREDARSMIINSDIGITWRDESLNNSLELSTKLLEYGSLGKAVILNRTPMHEKIFGKDYPLFANSMEDFQACIKLVIERPDVYRFAAERMFNSSLNFTFSETLKKLVPHLYKSRLNDFLHDSGYKIVREQTNQLPILLENRSGSRFVMIKTAIKQVDTAIDFIFDVSETGLIVNYYLQNHEIYTVIAPADHLPLSEKIENNLKSPVFKEILNTLLVKLCQINDSRSSVKNMKLKSKFQFQTLDNDSQQDNNYEVRSLRERLNKLEQYEKKYFAIANSKLGKLTLKYWKFKRKK